RRWAVSSIAIRCCGSSWRSAPTSCPAARSIRSGARCSCVIPIGSWSAPTRGRRRAGRTCGRPRPPCNGGSSSYHVRLPSRSPGRTGSGCSRHPELVLQRPERVLQAVDQLDVRLVSQAAARIEGVGPQHLVHLVVVLADLAQRPHAIPPHAL